MLLITLLGAGCYTIILLPISRRVTSRIDRAGAVEDMEWIRELLEAMLLVVCVNSSRSDGIAESE